MAKDDSPGISFDVVRPVIRVLGELGLDLASLVPPGSVDPNDPFTYYATADAGLERASELLGDPALGVTIVERLPVGALGLIDYALSTSVVLRDGVRRLARYYGIATQRSRLSFREEPPLAVLELERREGIRYGRHAIEFAWAIIADRIRRSVGSGFSFERVAFAHAGPEDTARYDAFFGTPVTFSAPTDRLVFKSELLDLPLLTAASSLAEMLEAKMREIAPGPEHPLLARARRAISTLLDRGDTGVDSAASALRMSRRTLQRELQELGTSHKAILDDIRRERASRLLASGEMGVPEVARSLGFSEASAFYRAFRRWTGSSPGAFRDRGAPDASGES
jgi:AraC-like DNA-binding protein